MKLDAWMEQDHPLDESLRLVESLCQAVNEVHDRGEALGALQPDRVEVGPGGHCDISAASGGTPSPAYAPPDGEGDSAADVFAAGMIAWEVLAGRSAGESPQHLAEVRPDIPKELADAIMACLERSADWRPKDLTFLAQMAAVRQKSAGRPAQQRRATRTPRRSPGRTRSHREGRRSWPLLAALVVVVALAFFAWQQFGGTGGFPWSRTAPAPEGPPPPAPVTEPAPPANPAAPPADAPATAPTPDPAVAEGDVAPADATAPGDPATQAPPPAEPAPAIPPETETETAPPPPPATAPAPAVAPPPTQTAPPEPPPTSRPAPSTQPVVPPAPAAPPPAAPDTSGAGQPAAPAPRPEVRPAPATPPEPAPPAPPAALTAVSPLEVKRPGQVLLDLRGQGFQEQHLVRVLAVKKPPRGITVVRQKRDNETLIKVLLDLSEDAETGDYALVLENSLGERTESVVFKVTK